MAGRLPNYLFDTSVMIDFSKAHTPVGSWMAALIAAGDVIGTCGVIVSEFYSGLPTQYYPIWAQIFGGFEYWEITPTVAVSAGRYRYEQARLGRIIQTADALIAAVAAEHKAVIVTRNLRHFTALGLHVQAPPQP